MISDPPFAAHSCVGFEPFRPPISYRGGHRQTIFPSLFRKLAPAVYQREILRLPDGDELALDWDQRDAGSDRLLIVSYGLEGDAQRPYVLGMRRAFAEEGYDVLVWNPRGLGGHMNPKPFFYHAGMFEDLAAVIDRADQGSRYREIVLVGFSLGAVFTLNYLGDRGADLPSALRSAVCFSAPIDFASCERQLRLRGNAMYLKRFLRSFRQTMTDKYAVDPRARSPEEMNGLRTLGAFDDQITARNHGFDGAEDYYAFADCRQRIPNIQLPTLVVNAADDPFLGPECYPHELEHDAFHFEVPKHGGHVGFLERLQAPRYWSERRALAWAKAY